MGCLSFVGVTSVGMASGHARNGKVPSDGAVLLPLLLLLGVAQVTEVRRMPQNSRCNQSRPDRLRASVLSPADGEDAQTLGTL